MIFLTFAPMNRSHGIVLRSLRYNDTQVIVSIFTEAAGTMDFIVRRAATARQAVKASTWAPLTLVEVAWEPRQRTSLQRPRELALWRPWHTIPFNPSKAAMAIFLGELLGHALRSEQANRELFAFAANSLEWFDESEEHYANFHIVFLTRLTRFLGFMPNADEWHPGSLFDLQAGSFVDAPPPHSYYLEPAEAALVPKFLRMNVRSMQPVGLNGALRRRALDIITQFYRLHVPEFPELKSLSVLADVFA